MSDQNSDDHLLFAVEEQNRIFEEVVESIDGLNASLNSYHRCHAELQIQGINRLTSITNLLWVVIALLAYIAYQLT